MAHHSRLSMVVVDVGEGEHDEELAFWQRAVGQTLTRSSRYPEYHRAELPGQGIGLLVQRLGEGDARVHLDIHTDDVEAEVARLEALGATRVRQVDSWWIMEDPAGLLFCVVEDSSGAPAEEGWTRWE